MQHKVILACFFFLTPLISVLACDPIPEWAPPTIDKWNNIMKALLASEKEEGLVRWDNTAPPVAVDRTNGYVYTQGQSNGGALMVSTDQGHTFKWFNKEAKDWGFIFNQLWISPDGGKIAVFSTRCGFTLDSGKTWTYLPSTYIRYGLVNWDDDSNFVFAQMHGNGSMGSYPISEKLSWDESKGKPGMKPWVSLLPPDKGSPNIGILPGGILVMQSSGAPVMRSEDSGKTWDSYPAPTNPNTPGLDPKFSFNLRVVTFKKESYWLASGGVYTTADMGKTWTVLGNPFPASLLATDAHTKHIMGVTVHGSPFPPSLRGPISKPMEGPFFGKDSNHLIVMLADKFIESFDRGVTWHKLADTPIWVWDNYACAFAGYDPINDILYFSTRHFGNAHHWVENHFYNLYLARWGTIDKSSPSIPANLQTSSLLPGNKVQLTWSPSTDNTIVKGYNIYVNDVLLCQTPDTMTIIRDLNYKKEYKLSVRAFDIFKNISDKAETVYTTGESLKLAYLSDLNWVSAVSGNFLSAENSVSKNLNAFGKPINLLNKDMQPETYRKGLGVTTDSTCTQSKIIYQLSGKYTHFFCDIGSPDDIVGSSQFAVYAGDSLKFKSQVMTKLMPSRSIEVDISGADTIQLVVTSAGTGCAANWADPIVAYIPKCPSVVSVLPNPIDLTKMLLFFDFPVDAKTAQNISHYTITPSIKVTSAVLQNPTMVILNVQEMTDGPYTLSIAGVKDFACGSSDLPQTITFSNLKGKILTLKNGDYELPKVIGNYPYNKTDTSWDFSGVSGILPIQNIYGAIAPNGIQTAFLKNNSIMSQSFECWEGQISFAFKSAQRGKNAQKINIYLDDVLLGEFTPTSNVFADFQTTPVAITTGKHQIKFQGMNIKDDNTAFIDLVSVNFTPTISK